jgi:vacuolar-type H+-ATPase subunit I/STV1
LFESEIKEYDLFLESINEEIVLEGELYEVNVAAIGKAVASKAAMLKDKAVNILKNLKNKGAAQIAKLKAAGRSEQAQKLKQQMDDKAAAVKANTSKALANLKQKGAMAKDAAKAQVAKTKQSATA